jgi:hypothetical protein
VFVPANTTALTSDKRPVQAIGVSVLPDHPVTASGQFVIGSAMELQPSGATFSPPIDVTIKFEPTKLPAGLSPGDLTLGYFDTTKGSWVLLDSTVDSANHTVTAPTTHFTTFAILNQPPRGINWGVLLAILLLDAAIALAAYFYVRRRRRLAAERAAAAVAAEDADEGEGLDDEEVVFEEWRFQRRYARSDNGDLQVAGLLPSPRARPDVVDGEILGEYPDELVTPADAADNADGRGRSADTEPRATPDLDWLKDWRPITEDRDKDDY